MSFVVKQPGLLSLLQDGGRYGQHNIGLTTGGPLDPFAYQCCNRLLGNTDNAVAIEVSFGGLQLEARVATFICVTGADMPLRINQTLCDGWRVHPVAAGDCVSLDFATDGCRAYLGVADGFAIEPQFGSAATVVREKIGGLDGDKLKPEDELPCQSTRQRGLRELPVESRPRYGDQVTVRVVPGYQVAHFSRAQQRRFYSSEFTVSERCDRMGYRLEGPTVSCELDGILSEGICFGAIQVPADGQPIVLLNDRQTIGGYPKLGSALSLDAARLSQLRPGAKVSFSAISQNDAHNALHLAASRLRRLNLPEYQQ